MRRFNLLLATGAAFGFLVCAPFLPTRADNSPVSAGAEFQANVTVTSVDIDRDRVEVASDSGHAYTLDTYQLDTYQAVITLRDTDSPGHTGDLVPGMRLRVRGTLVSPEIVEVKTVQVLPFRASKGSPGVSSVTGETGQVTLRGTVESVDSHTHLIVVRVRDHVRTVYINSQTDLQDVDSHNLDHLAYLPGQRVTVEGTFQQDGTILAGTISRHLQPSPRTAFPPVPDLNTLVGPVTKQSSRYGSRDIKVRVSSSHEVTVHVPRDTQIFRSDRLISVHDLAKTDIIRVRGVPDGDDFKASRIDVLRSADQGL